MNSESPHRSVARLVHGMETSDGAGVSLTRIIGSPELPLLDPFLMLDAFRSDDPDDYIAGFPSHPHRGFETVTYLIAGRMRHRDSIGHEGVLEAGGVQWMTAGSGVIHSEIPEQENGLLYGFQLWVNLPAARKMTPPRYQEFSAAQIPQERRLGALVRIIAGETSLGGFGPVREIAVAPMYLDVTLDRGADFQEAFPSAHNTFVYVMEGAVQIGDRTVGRNTLAVLSEGALLRVRAVDPARFLLVAGMPLHEPVARHGPFVMNTQAELVQAFRDYSAGKLVAG